MINLNLELVFRTFLSFPETRRAIHVGNLTFNDGQKVEEHLVNDIMQSIRPWLAELMDNVRVLMYSGQLDIIVAAPLSEAFLKDIKWSGQEAYLEAKKNIWKVSSDDVEVAGYVRKVKNFHEVIVRNAGHILPYDQPRVAYQLIKNFIEDKF